MTIRFFIRTALVAACPVTLAAQMPAMRPGAVTASVGAGSGSASFSCDACVPQRDAGPSGLLRIGVAVHPSITLGAEAAGWAKKYVDPQGSANARFLFVNATMSWHPRPTSGLFAKAGGGLASIKDDITIPSLGLTSVTTTAPAFVLGAGWNLPLGHRWALTPFADFNYAARSDQSVNGLRAGQKLGGTLMQIGVAATIGGPFKIRQRPMPAPEPFVPPINQDSIDRARAEQARLDSLARARQLQQEERDRFVADSVAGVREAVAVAARETEAMRVTLVTAVYYDLNKADLREDTRQMLDAKMPILIANQDVTVRISGHTDARGSGETNQQLGQRRVAAVRDYLIARGVSASRIELVNFGKERPVCQSDEESCWARNRRVEFEITGGAAVLKKP